MKNLQKLTKECMAELRAIGIEYGNVIEVVVNTRAKKRWGQCKRLSGGFSINISSRLLEDSVSDEATKTTIIHELLHTCKNCSDHGTEWKMLAGRVNQQYGYHVKRCTSSEEKGITRAPEVKHYKYIYRCVHCGCEVKRMKKSRFTEHPELYRCTRCHGQFVKVS